MNSFTRITNRALNNLPISREDALSLVHVPFHDLLHAAHQIRYTFLGNRVHLCAIVNARSGACPEDCVFCAQSARYSGRAAVYPMSEPAQLISAAETVAARYAGRFGVVTSGGSAVAGAEREKLLEGLEQLSAAGQHKLCVSLGMLDDDMLSALRECGITRIHHNLETSRNFFPRVCTTHSYDDRLATIKRAQHAGFEVCCGGLFGLGESWEDRIDLAMELRALGITSIPLNFINPVPGTPLEHAATVPPRDALRSIAIFRFVLPQTEIKVAGGREVTFRDLQSWIFYAGASSMMIGNYLTTNGRDVEADIAMIRDLGLEAVCGQR